MIRASFQTQAAPSTRKTTDVSGCQNLRRGEYPGHSELSNVVAITAGHQLNLALTADGQVTSWGTKTEYAEVQTINAGVTIGTCFVQNRMY